ncbi:MAG: hypothetical protein ACPGRX_05200 [Bdellovibrionales bacterium]
MIIQGSEIEKEIFGNNDLKEPEAVARAMIPYIETQMRDYGTPVKSMTRHMMGLFHQQAGAKAWRRALSTYPYEDGAGSEVIEKALADKNASKRHSELVSES